MNRLAKNMIKVSMILIFCVIVVGFIFGGAVIISEIFGLGALGVVGWIILSIAFIIAGIITILELDDNREKAFGWYTQFLEW